MKVLVCLMLVCLSWGTSAFRLWGPKLSCNCGWRNRGRIVGGIETRKNEYPWMVSVNIGCGGSILTPHHVLTAAHCTDKLSPSKITVSVGRHYQTGTNEHSQEHKVAKIIQHEGYDDTSSGSLDDISILVLATPIRFNKYVGPVCMPSKKFDLVGKHIKVTGWGLTKGTGSENALREVDLKVISNSACKKSWPQLNSNPTQICAYTPKKDSCNGDSGGALVYLDPATNRYTQVALVSYGSAECGTDPRPSVNTDVYVYGDWVKKAIAQNYPEEQVCKKVSTFY